MIGLPIILSALALMGAPHSTPAYCNPDIATYALGITWFANGSVVRMEYAPVVCAGLLYLSASPGERASLRSLNPGENFPHDEGTALLAVLHESHHASGDYDETHTECVAMHFLSSFIDKWIPLTDRVEALQTAINIDAHLPAIYHKNAC